jgi:hypothetical protein
VEYGMIMMDCVVSLRYSWNKVFDDTFFVVYFLELCQPSSCTGSGVHVHQKAL